MENMKELEGTAVCACGLVHEDKVRAALSAAPGDQELQSLGDLFKVFADPTRLKILSALSETELCVCDLSAVLGATQSAVSHQLALLRAASLVKYRREGKTVYYSLADSHVRAILLVGLDHVGEEGGKNEGR
jgi:ArsR family transcriptional regulator